MAMMKAVVFRGKDDLAIEEHRKPEAGPGEAVIRGTLSSLGVYSGKLTAPYEAIYAGLADQKVVTTLCPGGKERMRRLMEMVATRRVDLSPLVTHRFGFDDIAEAFELFSGQRDGVMKVALYPGAGRGDLLLQTAAAGAGEDQC